MNMPRVTLIAAQILILIGAIGYTMSGAKTSLIPAFLGALLGVCGMLATKEKFRMHAMHGAALVGLLAIGGTVGSIPKVISLIGGGTVERPLAVQLQSATFVVAAVFMVLAVNSFIQARKMRKAQEG